MILKGGVDMEDLEKEYRINEQGMVLECLERPESSIKGDRKLSFSYWRLCKFLRSIQNLVTREEKLN